MIIGARRMGFGMDSRGCVPRCCLVYSARLILLRLLQGNGTVLRDKLWLGVRVHHQRGHCVHLRCDGCRIFPDRKSV
jgi:hypothetical protein